MLTDPEAAADLLNSAKEIQEGETSKPSLSLLEEQGHSLEVQIQHRKAELARRRASDALSTMQLTKGHEQVVPENCSMTSLTLGFAPCYPLMIGFLYFIALQNLHDLCPQRYFQW